MPVQLCAEFLLLGLILLWFTKKQRTGKVLTSIGTVLLLLWGNAPAANRLLRPLESRYPPLMASPGSTPLSTLPRAAFIVVLGGGHTSDPYLPVTSRPNQVSAVRLAEAIRLYRQLPGSRMVLSGGRWLDPVSEAEIMAQFVRAFGVSERDIVLETESRDTEEEARLIRPTVGSQPFILVTSAAHMPRSVALFRKLGMNPIPAPTNFLSRPTKGVDPADLYPQPAALYRSDISLHEYLALIWEKLRGKT